MQGYLKNVVRQLKNYSLSINKKSILIDKPWALIDEEFELQKLIFKKDNKLVLSKNGAVQEGKWEYFPEAKSLIIDRNYDKILCNEAFIDEGAMILKLDGTDNRFFILANENVVPDLDVNSYLQRLRYQKLNIGKAKLNDGRVLEIARDKPYRDVQPGDTVSIDAQPMEDGTYKVANKPKYLEIRRGRIVKILNEVKYINPEGNEIFIQQKNKFKITQGDKVYIPDQEVERGVISFSKFKNLVISEGEVVKLQSKNPLIRLLFMEGNLSKNS